MKRTLMVSVAALALAAGSTIAMSQGGGGRGEGGGAGIGAGGAAGGGANAPMNSPAGAGAAGGASGQINELPAPGRGAQQDRAPAEKQQKSTQSPAGTQPSTRQTQGEQDRSGTGTRQSQGERDKNGTTTRQSQGEREKSGTQQGQAPSATGSKQGTAGTQGAMRTSNVSLTTEQRTVVRSKVLTSAAPRVTNVNFDIRVGTVVPRTVRIAPVPVTLIEIEPTWRGFMYFVSGDTIIVVEPRTLEIVAVLEV